MRSLLSLLLALIILAAFGGLAFFFINISTQAEFERRDKVEVEDAPKPERKLDTLPPF